MRNKDSDYVFIVMRPHKNECSGCYCDEHWTVDSVWDHKEGAEHRADLAGGGYVLARYVRSATEELP